MKIQVFRKLYTAKSTISDIFIDNVFFGYGLEPSVMHGTAGVNQAIPEGKYDIEFYDSPKFSSRLLRVMCAEEYGVILLHNGNFPKDTEGCLILGRTYDTDWVGESKVKLEELSVMLDGFKKVGNTGITIEYIRG